MRTLVYAQRPTGPLHIDLFEPAKDSGTLVIYAYGGGFSKGSRLASRDSPLVKTLIQQGFSVAITDYRLNTNEPDVPEPMRQIVRKVQKRVRKKGYTLHPRLYGHRLYCAALDLSDAVRFCRSQNIAQRVAMVGVSAGGLTGNTMCYPPSSWQRHLNAPDALLSLGAPILHPWAFRHNGPPLLVIHGGRDRVIAQSDSFIAQEHAKPFPQIQHSLPPDAPHSGLERYILRKPQALAGEANRGYMGDVFRFLSGTPSEPH